MNSIYIDGTYMHEEDGDEDFRDHQEREEAQSKKMDDGLSKWIVDIDDMLTRYLVK